MRIAVLGAGAWGTALALTFSAGHTVSLWEWDAGQARALRSARENRRYLPGYLFPHNLTVEDDITAAVCEVELVIVATPVAGLRPTARLLEQSKVSAPVVWACKGLEPASGKLPHQVVGEELGASHLCAALSGPSFAAEVAKAMPTAVTLASADLDFARRTVAVLNTPRLRLYANDDVVGVEIGGAVKNVLAIAAGMA